MSISFSCVGEKLMFEKNRLLNLSKNPDFCRKKTMFFGIKKLEWVHEYLEISKNMADSGIRTHHLCLPNGGDAHTFVLVKVITALQESLRVMGKFRKRKNFDYWIRQRDSNPPPLPS